MDEFELVAARAYEMVSAAFKAADLIDRISHRERGVTDEWGESGVLELDGAEAFLEALNSHDLAFEEETATTFMFPSGVAFRIVSGPTHRPAYVRDAIPRTLTRATERPGLDENGFLQVFVEEIVAGYERREYEAETRSRCTRKIVGQR